MTPIDVAKLPYQETPAYKKVLREFQRTAQRTSHGNRKNTVPLIRLSKEADRTMKVKQLYPPQDRGQRKSSTVKKFASKIITSLKVI